MYSLIPCSTYPLACVGLSGFSQNVAVGLTLERDKFSRGVEWLRDLVYSVVFTQERVRVIATKVKNSIAELKRDGYTVAKDMLKLITFGDVSNMHWDTILRQQNFLKVSFTVQGGPSDFEADGSPCPAVIID